MVFLTQIAHGVVFKKDYIEITNALTSIYGKQIDSNGGLLKFTLKEVDQAANAYAAKRSDNNWEITVISSLLSLNEQTKASLGIVLCHEIGHFLGGQPYVVGVQLTPAVRSNAPKKMSCEGQADYFATSECLRKLTTVIPDLFSKNTGIINPYLNAECEKSYTDSMEIKVCQETLVASYQASIIYQKIMEQLKVPASFFSKIDNEKSDRTLNLVGEYPTLDCRYETFINGALCSGKNSNVCSDMKWSRPACWFQDIN